MRVSVLIRTLNEAENLGRTIELVRNQNFSGEVEIVVLDSGSKDNTVEVAQRAGVRVLTYNKPFSYGGTINMGAEVAAGDVLVVLSAHAFPYDRAWLSELVKPLKDSSVAATSSRHVAKKEDDPFIRRGVGRRFPCRFIYSYVGCPMSVSNVSAAYKRELILKYPFDEGARYSEDYLWANGIMREGYRVVYVPTSVVIHADTDLRSLRRQAVAVAVLQRKRRMRWGLAAFCFRFLAMLIYDMPVVLRGPDRLRLFVMSTVRRWNIALAWWAAHSGADEYRSRFWWVLFWPLLRAFGSEEYLSKRGR